MLTFSTDFPNFGVFFCFFLCFFSFFLVIYFSHDLSVALFFHLSANLTQNYPSLCVKNRMGKQQQQKQQQQRVIIYFLNSLSDFCSDKIKWFVLRIVV